MKRSIFIFLFNFCVLQLLQAQTPPCVFDRMHPFESYYHINQQILKKQESNRSKPKHRNSHIYTIPVVVHIIHDGGPSNISEAQVQDAIDVLNEDFGKMPGTNGDGIGVDTKIRFCLAKKDPNGNCTNGIVRIQSPLSDHKLWQRSQIVSLSFWDNTRYMNIYVLEHIELAAGYSSRPGFVPEEDIVAINHDHFGRIGTATGLGRTMTHEAGHWLGLLHPFQNSCGNDVCNDGDFVCDTPPVYFANFGCPVGANSCSNDNPDLPDLIENYMDYTDETCMNMFTQGQADRIHAMLDTVRTLVWTEANLQFTGCDSAYTPPSNCPVVSDFVTLDREICMGNEVYFMDRSLNSPSNWQWFFPGGVPGSSTNQNPTVQYNSSGVYQVSLTVSDGTTTDSKTMIGYITVNDPGRGDSLSVAENFDNGIFPPLLLDVVDVDNEGSWELDTIASYSAPNSIAWNHKNSYWGGNIEELVFPYLDFSLAHPDSSLYLSYKWAYASSSVAFTDKLYVLVSTDCGVNFDQAGFQERGDIITGPLQSDVFVPDSLEHWDSISIDLSAYRNDTNVLVKFVSESRVVNKLYLDDIYLGDGGVPRELTVPVGIPAPKAKREVNVYPNPANNKLVIEWGNANYSHIELIAINGAVVLNKIINRDDGQVNLNTSGLSEGIYTVVIKGPEAISQKKVMIMR